MKKLYEELVADYSQDLYRFAYRFCGNSHIAEDLVAEAYTEAWRNLATLRNPDSARAWLYKILRYRCLNWLRSKRRHPQPTVSVEELEPFLASESEKALDKAERCEELQLALDSLDERYRETFLMVFLEGLSCKEAAQELKVPIGTVLSRVHRAREQLREKLQDYWLRCGNTVRERKIMSIQA